MKSLAVPSRGFNSCFDTIMITAGRSRAVSPTSQPSSLFFQPTAHRTIELQTHLTLRVSFVLLISAISVFIGAVSGSNIKLRASQDQLKFTRLLRTDATITEPDGEERGIADLAKTLSKKTKNWAKDKKLAAYVKMQSAFVDTDKTAQKFLKKSIHPDKVEKWLGLTKEKNRWVGLTDVRTPEYKLWEKYTELWKSAHPAK